MQEINVGLFPVVVVALYGDVPERTLFAVARRLKDEFEGFAPVLEAEIVGDRDELVEIIADPTLMQSYAVSPLQVLQTVKQNNRVIAAGALQDDRGRFPVSFVTRRRMVFMHILHERRYRHFVNFRH